jgi:hypothetical protein
MRTGLFKCDSRCTGVRAFTLVDLMVMLGALFFLALLIRPAAAGPSGAKSKEFQCLLNQKQIMAAMLMYAQDYSEFLPPNPDDGNTVSGHNWCADFGESYDPTRLGKNCMLMPYLNTNTALFRCTAERRIRRDPSRPGVLLPIVRSISMNESVGTICPGYDSGFGHAGKPTLSVNGPWLDNAHAHRRNQPYRTYGKTSEFVAPSPSQLWVLLEEDVNSINDASFAMGIRTAEWIDFPSSLHEFGCVFAFADGHSELKEWADSRTEVKVPISRVPVPGSVDWQWMAQRTSARAQ